MIGFINQLALHDLKAAVVNPLHGDYRSDSLQRKDQGVLSTLCVSVPLKAKGAPRSQWEIAANALVSLPIPKSSIEPSDEPEPKSEDPNSGEK